MASETPSSICNIALARIGGKEISSFENDASREAVLCRRLFHPARRTALAAYTWNGAKRDAQLTVNSNITPIFWTYAYPTPDDFVRLVSVHPSNDPNAGCEYSLQDANSTYADTVILTDSNALYIQYIFDCSDINILSQGFRDILGFVLARDLCGGLNKSAPKYELTSKEYKRSLTIAKSIDGQEGFPSRMADGNWIRSRFGPQTDQSIINS